MEPIGAHQVLYRILWGPIWAQRAIIGPGQGLGQLWGWDLEWALMGPAGPVNRVLLFIHSFNADVLQGSCKVWPHCGLRDLSRTQKVVVVTDCR